MAAPTPSHRSEQLIERRLEKARRRKQRPRQWLWWAGGVALILVGLVVAVVGTGANGEPGPHAATGSAEPTATAVNTRAVGAGRTSAAQNQDQRQAAALLPEPWPSPTVGKPLSLDLLPAGGHLMLSLRLAEILESPTGRDVLAGLASGSGDPLDWFKPFCTVEPERVEHLLISWIPSTDGQPPRAAAVVHLRQAISRSELLRLWGNPEPELVEKGRFYLASSQADGYYIRDDQTFAVAPPELMREVASNSGQPQVHPRLIEALMPLTDDRRHVSVLFDREFLRDDAPQLLPARVVASVEAATQLLGDDAPAGILSVHLEPNFFAELVVQGSTGTTPTRLAGKLDERWQQVPYDLLDLVGTLRARRGVRLVGRFPAMVKALALCTSLQTQGRAVQMRALLPQRAGPNFAWATPLVIDAAAQRGSSVAAVPSGQRRPARSLTLAQRLARPVSVKFQRTPLREAITMLGEEAGIDFQLLMKDLENVGVTGNIPQEGDYRAVPSQQILDEILSKLELVYLVNESENKIVITSRKAALQRGQIAE